MQTQPFLDVDGPKRQ